MCSQTVLTPGGAGSVPQREKKDEMIPEERDYPQQRGKGRGLREEGTTAQGPGGQIKLTVTKTLASGGGSPQLLFT